MNTNIDIKDRVFEALNVSDVTDYINGTLYNGKKPVKDERGEDIVLAPLPINSEFVQSATINVNCFTEDVIEGVPDYERLNDIFIKVLGALNSYTSSIYFDIDVVSQDVYDAEETGWSYINARLNCKILKS